MKQLYVNNFATALVGAVAAGGGILSVASATGLPTPSAGQHFLLTLIGLDANGNEVLWEVVKVTNRSGTTLTAVRGQEGTARDWPDGTLVEARLTAGSMDGKEDAIQAGTAGQFWRGDKSWQSILSAVQNTLLTGINFAVGTSITESDSLLSALGKLQKQITNAAENFAAGVRQTALSSYLLGSNTPLSSADTVEGAFGKVQAQLDSKVPSSGGVLSGDLGIPSLNGGQLAGMRNKIISGKMEITQRGVSFPAANGYTLDRWQVLVGGGGAVTASQQADAPPSNEFRTSLRVAVTTADTSIAASDYALVIQKVEGYNARDLIGRTSTLSFWVRSPKAGVHCVAFRNATPDRSYVIEYTVFAPNTWERKTATLPGGLITAGAWDWLNGTGLDVVFALAAGSNFRTAAGTWQTGNFIATADQVNCLDAVGNIFAITGVQLEVGPVATPFEHRPHGLELSLCQRYYELVPLSIAIPTMSTGAPSGNLLVASTFAVPKRGTPTIVRVQDNHLFSSLNTSGSTFYPVTPNTVGAYRATGGYPGQVQFSELVSASAEL